MSTKSLNDLAVNSLTYKAIPIDDVDNSDDEDDKFYCRTSIEKLNKSPIIPKRYLICVLGFFGYYNMLALRQNLSVAVVAMTSYRNVVSDNGTIIQQKKDFEWSSQEKGHILSSFYYGYLISEIPFGWLGARFGGATVYGVEVLCAALSTLLLPSITIYGPYAVFLFRVLTGLFEGGTLPCIHAIWSRWAPAEERTRLSSITMAGGNLAAVICAPFYGTLVYHFGWESVFYIPGSIAILWCIIWFSIVKNDPIDDKSVNVKELDYIKRSTNFSSPKTIRYPWKDLLTSVPMWTAVFTFFLHSWGALFLVTELPSYFNDVWKMNVKRSGFLITVPFIGKVSTAIIGSFTADYLIVNTTYSTTTIRKWTQAISGYGTACCYVLVALSNSPTMAIVCLSASCVFYGLSYASIFCNPLDIAPKYASLIMGIMTTASSLAAIMSPTLCGYLVTEQNKQEWTFIFFICGGMAFVGATVFSIFGSGQLQPWAVDDNTDR